MLIGIAGASLIMIAWIVETYLSLKEGEHLNVKFLLTYIAGSALLTYYSFELNLMPFIVLHAVILAISIIELGINLRRTKQRP